MKIKEVPGYAYNSGYHGFFDWNKPNSYNPSVMVSSSFCCAFPSGQNLTQGRTSPSRLSNEENENVYHFFLYWARKLQRPLYITVTEKQTPFFDMFTKSEYASYVGITDTRMVPEGSYKVALVVLEVPEEDNETVATRWGNRYPASFQVGV